MVVVESPSKAQKVAKFLEGARSDERFEVLASYGHVRDLEPVSGAVLPEDDFRMSWTTSKASVRAKEALRNIERAVLGSPGGSPGPATRVVLATDPDREGEGIAWHLDALLADAAGGRASPAGCVDHDGAR